MLNNMQTDEMGALYQSYLAMDLVARQHIDGEPENTGKTVDHFVTQLVAFAQSDDILNVVPFTKSASE